MAMNEQDQDVERIDYSGHCPTCNNKLIFHGTVRWCFKCDGEPPWPGK